MRISRTFGTFHEITSNSTLYVERPNPLMYCHIDALTLRQDTKIHVEREKPQLLEVLHSRKRRFIYCLTQTPTKNMT